MNAATRGWRLPFVLALRELAAHRLRTAISCFAVFLGVAALLAMTAFSRGMERQNARMFIEMGGARVVRIEARAPRDPEEELRFARSPGLRLSDLEALSERVAGIEAVLPEGALPDRTVVFKGKRSWSRGRAVRWEQFAVGNYRFARSLGFGREAWERGEPMVAVGPRVLERLFSPSADPLGQEVTIAGHRLRIAAVLETSGPQDARSWELLAPFDWLRRQGGASNPRLEAAGVVMADLDAVRRYAPRIAAEMSSLHRGVADVEVVSNEDALADAEKATSVMRLVTNTIAVIALVSGGVGILNILLASLSSRTRELGVEKALGAPGALLFRQVFLEAAIVSLAGGLAGSFVGSFPVLFFGGGKLPWVPELLARDYLLAFGLSVAMGVGAGLLPAWRAASLDPIEAMRA